VPRRISVKGCSGSGKSTLAPELARRLGLNYIELDALHHGPNWSEPTAEEFQARVRHKRRWPKRFGDDTRLVRLRSEDDVRRWLETTTEE
jgi:adenylate kinase family enzyme